MKYLESTCKDPNEKERIANIMQNKYDEHTSNIGSFFSSRCPHQTPHPLISYTKTPENAASLPSSSLHRPPSRHPPPPLPHSIQHIQIHGPRPHAQPKPKSLIPLRRKHAIVTHAGWLDIKRNKVTAHGVEELVSATHVEVPECGGVGIEVGGEVGEGRHVELLGGVDEVGRGVEHGELSVGVRIMLGVVTGEFGNELLRGGLLVLGGCAEVCGGVVVKGFLLGGEVHLGEVVLLEAGLLLLLRY